MEFVLGLPESLGLRRPLLLEIGLFRVQLGLELLQRLRLLRELDRFVRGLFPEGAFARLDLEESLFSLLRGRFALALPLRAERPAFSAALLPALTASFLSATQ